MTGAAWTWRHGDGPVLATAIHAGHELRPDVAALTALSDAERLREEDPHTDTWTAAGASAVVFTRSRWEVDVNRERARCVYLQPEDCWGLQPWSTQPLPAVLDESRRLYDSFYEEMTAACATIEHAYGAFVLLDLHSYNHRRLGAAGPPADPGSNPVVNLGTATLDRRRWGRLIDRFLQDLRDCGLDARENVRFRGAHLARWTHRTFPTTGCCLAVDVKKVFMDEHTGVADVEAVAGIGAALAATVPNLEHAIAEMV